MPSQEAKGPFCEPGSGVHVKVVAERLGDTEVTVMKTYSHVLPDMQEAAAAAIEPLLRGLLLG